MAEAASLPAEARPLLALVDAGDDSAPPLLADALEEAGDRRHVGIRYAIADRREPRWSGFAAKTLEWAWRSVPSFVARTEPHTLSVPLRNCLRGGYAWHGWQVYPTRSAAYLALADALISEE